MINTMIAAVLEIGMVVSLLSFCVTAITYTSDCEGRLQFRVREQKKYIIWVFPFAIFSLSVLVVVGFVILTCSWTTKPGFNWHWWRVSKNLENCPTFSHLELVVYFFKLIKTWNKFTKDFIAFAYSVLNFERLRFNFQSSEINSLLRK